MNNNAINEVIEKYPSAKREYLIPMLQDVQEIQGFVSKDSVVMIGDHLKLPGAKIYGVATFYNQFRFNKPGQFHIQICRGTACHVKGSVNVLESIERALNIKVGQTSRDGLFSLEVVACLGACGLAPVISVNGEFYANVDNKKLFKILKNLRKEGGTK
ncbi:MAG: NAD(P)H-dependent oxidoreductase subunit E [Candidatus Kapabacteria bacterium]|nr:NAD(P)H-dependent oxidoreductase subunit E [Candidatus Kapabacteria bacterium]